MTSQGHWEVPEWDLDLPDSGLSPSLELVAKSHFLFPLPRQSVPKIVLIGSEE